MDEALVQKDQILLVTAFGANIVQDFYLNFGAGVVAFDCTDDLYGVIGMVSEVLALEGATKGAIAKVTHYFVVAYFRAYFVLEMACILVFGWSLRPLYFLTVGVRGWLVRRSFVGR